MARIRLLAAAALAAASGWVEAARAQMADSPTIAQVTPDQQSTTLPDVTVIGSTPLLGSGVPANSVPANVQVLTPQEIDRTVVPSLTGALESFVPSVRTNDTSGNPFQPDLLFRGFTASPVEGEPQGLAVYVNGARFNTPFGDTVNWDLIPSNAIAQADVEGANPVFGLNALGGSVDVRLKDGFGYHGAEAISYGGAYGRVGGLLQSGVQSGNVAGYAALDYIHDGGWRATGGAEVRQFYCNLGVQTDSSEVHLSLLAADNVLGNPGATPVDLLSVDRGANSTAPNNVHNHYASLILSATHEVSDSTSVQGGAYVSNLSQRLVNGDTVDFLPCEASPDFLCEDDGVTPITTRGGASVPSALGGLGYSGLSQQGIDSTAYGASAQLSNDANPLGFHNHLVAGFSFDGGSTSFNSYEYVGGIDANRFFVGPGFVLDQTDLSFAPVSLSSQNRYYGLFFTDRLDLTSRLGLIVSGRFNIADISLNDRIGTLLTASHSYEHFNPGVGLTYQLLKPVQLYASYSEANRAPTPNELECADPNIPCQLPNAFISDPALKQVIAHTFEAGARGRVDDVAGGRLIWDADYFHTRNSDDIIFVSAVDSNAGGFFTNAGTTLRQGVEATMKWLGPRLRATVGYNYTDATYQSALALNSPNNPGASANGQIFVVPGDRIPGIPAHRGIITVDYDVTDRWTVGGSAILASSQFLIGDDANLQKPLGGYYVLNLNTSYRVTDHVQLFALVNNVTNERYSTFGTFAPVGLINPSFTNPRVYSPAPPVAGYAGVRVTF